jgi:DNA-binding XRE family transcriptional regulator
MCRSPGSEPVCLRCEITTDLHAVSIRNMRFDFRARLCETCLHELRRRRERWMAQPQAEPGSLRAVRLAAGLSVRELARRRGIAAPTISRVERGLIPTWPRYVERLTAAIGVEATEVRLP